MEIFIWTLTIIAALSAVHLLSASGGGVVMMTIAKIKQAVKAAGGHFFDADTMDFFSSRVVQRVWYGAEGVYFFVTSEQFVPSRGPAHPRRFTVRKWSESEPRSVESIGDFQKYGAEEAARKAAAALADASREGVAS